MESPNKPQVLTFIDWFAPGFQAGGPVRSLVNLVDHLKDDVHFRVVTRNTDYQSEEPYSGIQPNTWTKFSENCEVMYLSQENIKGREIAKIIKDTPHHALYINGIYSYYFSILPLYYSRKRGEKRILAPRGMLASTAIAIKSYKKMSYLSIGRSLGLFKNTLFHATSQGEVSDIKKTLGEKVDIKMAPNLPQKLELKEEPKSKPKEQDKLALVSIARIAPEKNLRFLFEILPEVRCGSIHLDIYGPVYDQAYWDECDSLIEKFPGTIQCEHFGSVDREEITRVLASADFLVMPTLGENYGHAIVESWGAGTPVIISDRTPWKNLKDQKLGADLQLDGPPWIEALMDFCKMDEPEYQQYSRACRQEYLRLAGDQESIESNRALFINQPG